MKYYIIAGEASGDLHASNLVAEIKKKDKRAEFRGCGNVRRILLTISQMSLSWWITLVSIFASRTLSTDKGLR